MKNKRAILGYFSILLFFTIGCSKPIQPTYLGYQNLRFGKSGTKNNVIMTDIKFYNPNKYALNVKEAEMDVYFNDRLLGHTSMSDVVILPPLDTTFVPFTIQASVADILANTAQIFLNPNVRVKVQGNAKAGRGVFLLIFPLIFKEHNAFNYQGRIRFWSARKDLTKVAVQNHDFRNTSKLFEIF